MGRIIENLELIELNVLELLRRSATDLMNGRTLHSPRAVGDAIQDFLGDHFYECIPSDFLKEYSSTFARRAMEDIAFTDRDDCYFAVDCKTHCLDTKFNMPNLISVERLARFYQEDKNYFMLLLVEYSVKDDALQFTACHFLPIEYFEWSCLTIGALGWGQIQIANSNKLDFQVNTRKKWMLDLCDVLDVFYPREIEKITNRLSYFARVRSCWMDR